MNGAIDDPASRAAMPKHEALVTDVREVQGGKEAVREVIKYMTKDIDSDGRRTRRAFTRPSTKPSTGFA